MKNSDSWSCGCMIAVLVFNIALGGWSIDYLLRVFTDKDIPFLADALIGLIVGEISIPLAIVVAILRYFGVI